MAADQKSLPELAIDALDTPVHVIDTTLKILLFNRAFHKWCERLGVDTVCQDVVGQNLMQVFPFLTSAAAEYEQVLDTGEPMLTESHTLLDGQKIYTQTTKSPIVVEGEVRYIITAVRDITDRRQAEAALQQAYAEVEKRVEEQTAELEQGTAERERLQDEVIEAQKRAIQELATPIIPVMERIIVMPLIGSIDSMRARDVTRSLLAGIRVHRAKVVILDITGVPIVDSGVADHLNKTIQAARLKGARTIITGISDAVAETVVDLGIDWTGVETLSDLQTGLIVALNSLGYRFTRA